VRGSGRTAAGEEQQESALVTADFKILFPGGKNQESANRFWSLIKKFNYFSLGKHWVKPMPMSKTGNVAPRKTSVRLCQVRSLTMIWFNVYNGSIVDFAVRQNCA